MYLDILKYMTKTSVCQYKCKPCKQGKDNSILNQVKKQNS